LSFGALYELVIKVECRLHRSNHTEICIHPPERLAAGLAYSALSDSIGSIVAARRAGI
jgi:hypothetical protein